MDEHHSVAVEALELSAGTTRPRPGRGEPGAALEALHAACRAWQDMEAPYEAAQVRVLIAVACRLGGDPDSAEFECDAARAVFERLVRGPR